jgi:hypothetical protein
MARSSTSRRTTDRRPGQSDRPVAGDLPFDDTPPTPSGECPPGDGSPVPTVAASSNQETQDLIDARDQWAALSQVDQQRLSRHFSRLVLLAVHASAFSVKEETLS